jgi:type I restriction enzyme S subunit
MVATVENIKTKWLGDFPEHWQALRIKNLFQEMDSRSETGSEELLSVSYYTGVTLKRESLENEDDHITNALSLIGYKVVKKGDLVINIMGAWNGRLGISPHDGITSPAYCVYRIKENNNPEYFGYLFTTDLFISEFRKNSTGIGSGFLRLYSDKFFSIFSIVPPKEEQDEIVQHIKMQSNKINLFIQKKQCFIELLKEQRQIVIHQLVTHGIDSKAKMKSSGIEWLGHVPKHWEIRRLKECLIGKLKYGANESGEEYNPLWFRYIRITDFSLDGKLDDEKKLSLPPEIGAEYELHEGDILFARSGATVGKTFQFHFVSEEEKYCYAGYLIKATPDENIILSDFLFNYTNSKAFENWKNSIFNKATIENIGADKYSVLKIPIPPIKEQKQIVAQIKTETAAIDTAIVKAEKEIELIKEYKAAMISEAVMGKIRLSKKSVIAKQTKAKTEPTWEFKEAVLISVLTDKFGSKEYPLGRKRYTKFSYLFHRHTDGKTEGYLKKAAGPYNPKTKYAGPEKIALQNKYIVEAKSANLSGFIASDKIQNAKKYFETYWNAESLTWLEQLRYKKNDDLELYATIDRAMVELGEAKKTIKLQAIKQLIEENPEWKPKLEREIFSDDNITKAIEFLKQLFA